MHYPDRCPILTTPESFLPPLHLQCQSVVGIKLVFPAVHYELCMATKNSQNVAFKQILKIKVKMQ